MTRVDLMINGRAISAEVEPRQHLGDFVREETLLTGTHLGCEHGVCGACTVLIDGAPARACIAFPVALDGTSITTIEGLADDSVTIRLRDAFAAEHALQCGFCTPGMLIMARDIVLRRPGASADTIRHELAGNLCRCTGYLGIVRAIKRITDEQAKEAPVVTRGSAVAPLQDASPLRLPVSPSRRSLISPNPVSAYAARSPISEAPGTPPPSDGLRNAVNLAEAFEVPAPRQTVWDFFQDPGRVLACLPGARLTAPSDGRTLVAEMVVKLGPIQAAFGGSASLSADPATWSGIIDGRGVDSRSSTRVQARLVYRLHPRDEASTKVEVDVAYVLQGPLAQMSRSALARDLAGRMTQRFAENLAASLKGGSVPAEAAPLEAGALMASLLKDSVLRLVQRAGRLLSIFRR